MLLEGVNPEVVLRNTLYVTLEVGDAVQLRLIDELEAAVAVRFEGGCGAGGFTTNVTFAECDRVPLVPVMVSVELPVGVEVAVAMLREEDPEVLMEAGLKVAVAPEGRPLALSAMDPVNPFCATAVTVYVVLPPVITVWELGVAEIVKSGLPPEAESVSVL